MPKIVLVDDSRLMRNLLRHILAHAGYEVEIWEDLTAAEIPERIGTSNPDLLITDYQMPGCNGLTVARMARKTRPELPVIVVTATRDPTVLDALKRVDVSRILHKPIRGDEVLEALQQVLERPD